MLSIPPATTTSADPATMMSCASIVAFIAEPHILDSVVQLTDIGSPALSAACLAGAWPWPAIRQLPNSSSCTSPGDRPARSTAALTATAPRSLAESDEKSPWKPPIGVRAAPTITIGSFCMSLSPDHPFPVIRRGLALFAGGIQRRRHGHFVSLNSSRPISIRRISDVPAPISYSFASRHSRPVGYSLMYPLPPSAWIASPAIHVAFSAA